VPLRLRQEIQAVLRWGDGELGCLRILKRSQTPCLRSAILEARETGFPKGLYERTLLVGKPKPDLSIGDRRRLSLVAEAQCQRSGILSMNS